MDKHEQIMMLIQEGMNQGKKYMKPYDQALSILHSLSTEFNLIRKSKKQKDNYKVSWK